MEEMYGLSMDWVYGLNQLNPQKGKESDPWGTFPKSHPLPAGLGLVTWTDGFGKGLGYLILFVVGWD